MPRCRIESLGVSLPRRGMRKIGSLAHAVQAGQQALQQSHYNRADIATLINAGVYRDRHYAEPAFACFIQDKLGINVEFQGRQTLSFDLLNGGCGLLSAAQVMTQMILSRTVQVGMIVASEANADRRPDPSYTYPASGAAAILDISPYTRQGFGDFVFKTLDQHHDLYGSAVSLAQAGGRLLVRKHVELEAAYLEAASQAWRELLERSELSPEQIDLVIPSQISSDFIGKLATDLALPRERFVDVSQRHGDTLTTSWMLALHDAKTRGAMREGSTCVILACGSGVTVGAATYLS